ncbi:hypothetical protein BKA82DRAFT_4147326 [Pisolithus tinctorius]|nr:hypothetical protein BKA82DRAFT_4147326 [Pisolithus tinctorius]
MPLSRLPARSFSGTSQGSSRPGTPRAHDLVQKEQWLQAARESTENFKLHGSPVPLVWFYTEENRIPPNAVPFSEDVNGCPLFIARVLLEGRLYLGKAAHHLNGAVVSYAGRDRIVSKYEVLTCASMIHWAFPNIEPNGVLPRGTVVLAHQFKQEKPFGHVPDPHNHGGLFNTSLRPCDIPRYIPDEHDRELALKQLAEIKTVILVDDSLSMTEGNLWVQAREALAGIIDIANRYGSKGVDLHFLHGDAYGENILSKLEVAKLFDEALPDGEDTPTGAKLAQLIDFYLPRVEMRETLHPPITVIVITDGAATDPEELEHCIVTAAHRLDSNDVKPNMFGIAFVQIGTDPAAADALRVLDDNLADTYKIRDMVDTMPFNAAYGTFDTEYMLKILLGVLRKTVDHHEHPVASVAPPSLLSPLATGTVHSSPRSLPSTLVSGGLAGGRSGSPGTPSRMSSLRSLPRE